MALKSIRVVEMAGLAPAPFCGMILADYGAKVVRVDKPHAPDLDRLGRGKRSIMVDLKKLQGANIVRRLCKNADIIIEPYRRGVMEKMGLGPDVLMLDNPGLIYARLTGFGQSGPYADMAGHDINYVALSGILSMLGRKDGPPTPPINLLADFAGGGLMCAMGIAMALFERSLSGQGQVIDCNMVEGAAYVGSWLYSSKDMPIWGQPRGCNWLDSGTHFYDTYETQDNRYMAVGALEPQFYRLFIKLLEVNEEVEQYSDFEALKKIIATKFKEKTQAEWCKIFDGKDACVTPVLSMNEAPSHPHNLARESFIETPRGSEPRPAPVLCRTPAKVDNVTAPMLGEHTTEILLEAGFSPSEVDQMISSETVVELKNKSKL